MYFQNSFTDHKQFFEYCGQAYNLNHFSHIIIYVHFLVLTVASDESLTLGAKMFEISSRKHFTSASSLNKPGKPQHMLFNGEFQETSTSNSDPSHYLMTSTYYGSTVCKGTPLIQSGTKLSIRFGKCQLITPSSGNYSVGTYTDDHIANYSFLNTSFMNMSFTGNMSTITTFSIIGSNVTVTSIVYVGSNCTGAVYFEDTFVTGSNINKCIALPIFGVSYNTTFSTMPVYTTGYLTQ